MSTYNIPAITITEASSGKHAIIDYNYSGLELINIPEDIEVDSVTLNKTFEQDIYNALQLPFDVNTANLTNVNAVLRYNGIRNFSSQNESCLGCRWFYTTELLIMNIKLYNRHNRIFL